MQFIDMHPSPRIDAHMLTLDEPAEWRAACIESLAGAPIRLHVLAGIAGRLGQGRAAGFACGDAPFVCWVDPDDLYEAGAFAQLADALDACPQAVLAYTDEALMDEAGCPLGLRRLAYSAFQHAHSASHVHGLIVMRRDDVAAVAGLVHQQDPTPEWTLTRMLARRGGVIHVPVIGRHWRQHPGQFHRRIKGAFHAAN
jgi:hypothetical protein